MDLLFKLLGDDRSPPKLCNVAIIRESVMTQTTEKRSLETHGKALSLYEEDILLWVEDTAAKLKAKDFENLDLENLIEEVESLGISQRRELLSRLTRLLEHLLKRIYVDSEQNYNGWEQTIRHQRSELKSLLKIAPSLKSKWQENIEDAWELALENIAKEYRKTKFPDQWPYSSDIKSMLDRDFWEN
jgi:hypothetical protein